MHDILMSFTFMEGIYGRIGHLALCTGRGSPHSARSVPWRVTVPANISWGPRSTRPRRSTRVFSSRKTVTCIIITEHAQMQNLFPKGNRNMCPISAVSLYLRVTTQIKQLLQCWYHTFYKKPCHRCHLYFP